MKAASELLLPLKIVDDLGSHGDSSLNVTKDDLLDAYEIFEHVIERVYVRSAERIAKVAAKLAERKTRGRSTK